MLMLELLSSSNWSQWHVSMLTTDSESGVAGGDPSLYFQSCLHTHSGTCDSLCGSPGSLGGACTLEVMKQGAASYCTS